MNTETKDTNVTSPTALDTSVNPGSSGTQSTQNTPNKPQLDYFVCLVPLALVLLLNVFFMLRPESSLSVTTALRAFMCDDLGIFYIGFSIFAFLGSLAIAFSKLGDIRLGKGKPEYSSFTWGSMIFTSTMAADTLFYSLIEWAMYANEARIQELGGTLPWASTYTLFHWGPIAWGFYIICAAAFGFMFHVRGREKQQFSEACRPLLGDKIDGPVGKLIDTVGVIGMMASTSTTFAISTPFLSEAVAKIFGLSNSAALSVGLLVGTCLIYTLAVFFGMKAIAKLAMICIYLFLGILAYVFLCGGEAKFILENGLESIGVLVQNFPTLMTYTDPLRSTSFAQSWSIFYWSYWVVACVGTPFFIGIISKGRTIREMILGGYAWGVAATFLSFIILGNYGIALDLRHGAGIAQFVGETANYPAAITMIIEHLPLAMVFLFVLVITMLAFYTTTFDSITMVFSTYSYKRLRADQEPGHGIRVYWAVAFIILPIALLFSEGNLYAMQSFAIIAAFPVSIILLMIIVSFFKDAKAYLKESKEQ